VRSVNTEQEIIPMSYELTSALTEIFAGSRVTNETLDMVKQTIIEIVGNHLPAPVLAEIDLNVIKMPGDPNTVNIVPENLITALCLVGIYPTHVPDIRTSTLGPNEQEAFYPTSTSGYYYFDRIQKRLRFQKIDPRFT